MTEKAVVGRIPITKKYGCYYAQKKVKYFVSYSPVKCPFCGETFINKHYLRKHIKIYHTERICPICGKRFYDVFAYNRHLREHIVSAKND